MGCLVPRRHLTPSNAPLASVRLVCTVCSEYTQRPYRVCFIRWYWLCQMQKRCFIPERYTIHRKRAEKRNTSNKADKLEYRYDRQQTVCLTQTKNTINNYTNLTSLLFQWNLSAFDFNDNLLPDFEALTAWHKNSRWELLVQKTDNKNVRCFELNAYIFLSLGTAHTHTYTPGSMIGKCARRAYVCW